MQCTNEGKSPQRFKLQPTWEIAESVCIIIEVDAYNDAVRKPPAAARPRGRNEYVIFKKIGYDQDLDLEVEGQLARSKIIRGLA